MTMTDMIKQLVRPVFCVMLLTSSPALLATQICRDGIPSTTPDSQLVDNGDGTVTDSKTGLMWKQCSEGLSGSDCNTGTRAGFGAQSALTYVASLNSGDGFAGHRDWRVPNIKELHSIIDHHCVNPALNPHRFPDSSQEQSLFGNERSYISSTPDTTLPSFFWAVDVYYGSTADVSAVGRNVSPLRLVRSTR